MALTKTRAELITETLKKIGVLASGQSPFAEDSERVEESIEPCLAYLSASQIAYVPNTNAIPNAQFNFIADILADFCKSKFGKAGSNDLTVIAEQAKTILQEMYFRSQETPVLRAERGLASIC